MLPPPARSVSLRLLVAPLCLGPLGACGNVVFELPGPEVEVDTGGSGDGEGAGSEPEPDIALSVAALSAVGVEVGCTKQRSVNVRNRGDADLTLESLELTIYQWDVEDAPDLPLVLAPDESVDLLMSFTPESPGDASGELIIVSDDPDEPEVAVSLTGLGERPEDREETWYQVSMASADVLFAVDTSEGAEDLAGDLSAGVYALMNVFAISGADVRVAAVIEDDGCINGLLDTIDTSWSASDAVATVTTMTTPNGGARDSASAAFQLFLAAADGAQDGACNEGLFELGRQVHLVGLSRKSEGSPEGYATYLDALAGVADEVVVHGIGGPFPSGCEGAEAYGGIYEATVATGGVFLSVCDPMAANLSDLAAEVVGRTLRRSFPVEGNPKDDHVDVFVEGEEVTEGLIFDSESRMVIFAEDRLPPIGSEIRVAWVEEPVCDE